MGDRCSARGAGTWLTAGMLALATACGGEQIVMYRMEVPHDSAELQVAFTATMLDFTQTLHSTLGRPTSGIDDCALFVHDWTPGTKDPLRITGSGVDLGASPVCGHEVGAVIETATRGGAIFVMPSIAGPMTWSDRPQREGDQPVLAIDRKTAFERVEERVRTTRHTLFVVEAPIGYNAYTMLRLAQSISRPGATVLFQPTQTPPTPRPRMAPVGQETARAVPQASESETVPSAPVPSRPRVVNGLQVRPTSASLRDSSVDVEPAPLPPALPSNEISNGDLRADPEEAEPTPEPTTEPTSEPVTTPTAREPREPREPRSVD